MSTAMEYFKDLLRSRKLRATPKRLQLLSNMQRNQRAMSHAEIQESLPGVDRVTLYRTLETFINQGIIHQAFRENNQMHYALCGETCNVGQHQHSHMHFKCESCETVTCKDLINRFDIDFAGEIHDISIQVKGICESCLGSNN